MDRQLIVEYLFDLALKQDVDKRETLSEMDKVFNQAIATAKAEALNGAAERNDDIAYQLGLNNEQRMMLEKSILADKQDK